MDRFSKENIDKLVKVPKKGVFDKFIRHLMGPIIDFSPFIGIIFFFLVFKILNIKNSLADFIILALFIIQLVLLYFEFIAFYKVYINKYKINLGLANPVNFVYVSDIHLGYGYASTNKRRLEHLVKTINKLNVDTVLFGGDYLTYDIDSALLPELSKIQAINKFGVYGNHDADYLESKVAYNLPLDFINAFKSSDINLLINNCVNLNIDGVNISIAGIPDLYSKNFNIVQAFEKAEKNSKRILLSHNPDVLDFVEDSDNIDLILSGHNHSGQIYMPFIGAVLPMPTKRKWLTKGIFNVGKKTKLLLSSGVGYSGSRLRINTYPEVCVITLY